MSLFSMGAPLNAFAQANTSPNANIALMRALAVASVFIHHVQALFGGNVPFFGDYGGQFGPQLFFVISGFLICGSAVKYSTRDFFIHRAFRILPAYWFYFFLFCAWGGLLSPQSLQGRWGSLLINTTMLQQLFPTSLLAFDVLHVTWTLTVELLWYLTVPVLIALLGRISARTALAATALSTGFMVVVWNGYLTALLPANMQGAFGYRYLFLFNSFPSQLCFFVYGGYLYFNQDKLKGLNPLVLMAVCVAIFLAKPFYIHFNPVFITGIGIACLMQAALNSAPVVSRVVHGLSEISFSVYLCHLAIMVLVKEQFHLTGPTGVALVVALTLGSSVATYWCIEKPGIAWGRRFSQWLKARGKPAVMLLLPQPIAATQI
ncbi:MAG: hypothetical protein CFE44_04465 [Burkholderiales bacterium PBB4]|nr:MAG: hypothetical protein CFE44_04465 [Burkholderiales bacterium PBB4]